MPTFGFILARCMVPFHEEENLEEHFCCYNRKLHDLTTSRCSD